MAVYNYYVNYCESGCCYNEQGKCTYPQVKEGRLEETSMDHPDDTSEIEKITFQITLRDKFHVNYPENSEWHGIITFGDNELTYSFKTPVETNHKFLSIEITDKAWINKFFALANNHYYIDDVKCEVYINDNIVCPISIDFFIYAINDFKI